MMPKLVQFNGRPLNQESDRDKKDREQGVGERMRGKSVKETKSNKSERESEKLFDRLLFTQLLVADIY